MDSAPAPPPRLRRRLGATVSRPSRAPEPDRAAGLVARLIGVCARHPILVLVLAALLGFAGYGALLAIPLDAMPDISETQVIITAEWRGRSPDLVESQVTYPLSTALLSAPKVKAVRGQSFFGIGFVYAIFEDGTNLYWARSRVLELVSEARARLPRASRQSNPGPRRHRGRLGVANTRSSIAPAATRSPTCARSRTSPSASASRACRASPRSPESAASSSSTRSPSTPRSSSAAASRSSRSPRPCAARTRTPAARRCEIAEHKQMIRGRGFLRTRADLENVPVMVGEHGVPVLLGHLGEVSEVPVARRGVAELDGEGEAVGGIVIMRHGENALAVIKHTKARLAEIQAGLPAGVRIETVSINRPSCTRRSARSSVRSSRSSSSSRS